MEKPFGFSAHLNDRDAKQEAIVSESRTARPYLIT
jgi:hypothetical protein